jgi:hypothetical protein
MDEPPARLLVRIGRLVEQTVHDALDEHEHRCHAVPPPDRSPLTAIPFANFRVTDDELSHAIEMLEEQDEATVARRLGIPLPALQRALADYQRRFGGFLFKRATGD